LTGCLKQHNTSNTLSGNCSENLIVKRITNLESVPKKTKSLMLVLGSSGFGKERLNILGQQLPRVLKRKDPYTAAFLNNNAKKFFEESIKDIKRINIDNNHLMGPKVSSDLIVEALVSDAAKIQKNVVINELDLTEYTKVYVLGHGSAGVGVIKSGDQYFNVEDIVNLLEKNGILSTIKDIRFVSCQSADKRAPVSMSDKDIQEANCDKGMLHRAIFGKEKSLIDLISNEIWSRGYSDISVSGYHGNGVFYDGKNIPLEHIRSSTIPASDIVKRKDVRETLYSEVD
ncbi:OspB protein, partial [Vibrio parahaemolyticus]|nr:OspB protein [Vibrio parahaemolyticus]EJG0659875.1 OspB protein [Vibrio parahaemolyticus]